MKKAVLPIILVGALTLLTVIETNAINIFEISINSTGSISYSKGVGPFSIRIADIMTDITLPNFDDSAYSGYWKSALNDLVAASPNGEITHVQMRIFWYLSDGLINPVLGADNAGQIPIMQNWKRWIFGYTAPGQQPLPYGPSAIEQIHAKGMKLELGIAGAWGANGAARPKCADWGGREADYPDWIAAGGGEQFLENYKNKVVLPVANFVKDYLQDGDIFCISMEMNFPDSDFTWNHNAKWIEIIDLTRLIFKSAGKNILITSHQLGWYSDGTLGYNAVKLQDPNATLSPDQQGISGAAYLSDLDFITVAHWWLPMIHSTEVPAAGWSDNDIAWLTERWFSNPYFYKVGNGYNDHNEMGRDFIADYRALSHIMGRKVLMNSGYANRHGRIADNYDVFQPITADLMEQRVAWMTQLNAIKDPRSNIQTWCAGQDFERYCRDMSAYPNAIADESWRRSPAESGIISEINAIRGLIP